MVRTPFAAKSLDIDSTVGLRRTALRILAAAAIGSGGLMVYAAERVRAPRVLLLGFTLWVLSPFALLALAEVLSKRWHWSVKTRRTLYGVMLVVAAASVIIYGVFALGGDRPKTAPFVLVAPASCLLVVLVIATTAFASRKR